jgi:hypothetical protein
MPARTVLAIGGVLTAQEVAMNAAAAVVVVLRAGDPAAGPAPGADVVEATAVPAVSEPAPSPQPGTAPSPPPAPTPRSAPSAADTGVPPALTFVGASDLGGRGANADLAVLDGYVYVGGYASGGACPGHGVRIVDISDPANPLVVASAAGIPGTTSEDVDVIRLASPAFTGTVLAVGIQRCGQSVARGGLMLVDVTDPRAPATLAFFDTSPGPSGVHELDVTLQPNGRALALLAVPLSERGGVGDFRVVEITDPRHPTQLAHWGAGQAFGMREGIGCVRRNQVHAHSARASADGTRAYVSYWDAGLIVMDISEPSRPRVAGRLFEPEGEGSIHSVDELDGSFLLVAEEIPRPYLLSVRVESAQGAVVIAGCESPARQSLSAAVPRTGPLIDGGQACAPAPASPGAVLLATADGCGLLEKTRAAAAAGAAVLLLAVAGEAVSTAEPDDEPLPLPVVSIGEQDARTLRSRLALGPVTVTLPEAMPAGGVRVWEIADPARPVRRSVFRTERAAVFPPSPPGNYTAHNPLGLGRFALVSWFADGVRLLDLRDPDDPREVAAWTADNGSRIWGVALSGDLVLLSDVRDGLFILRLLGLPIP